MRFLIITPLFLFLLFPSVSFGESFETFFEKFVKQSEFRSSRIEYPLTAKIGHSDDLGIETLHWTPEQVAKEFTPPLSREELKIKGYNQRIRWSTKEKLYVFQFLDEADSYLLMYHFHVVHGKWFLYLYEDASL